MSRPRALAPAGTPSPINWAPEVTRGPRARTTTIVVLGAVAVVAVAWVTGVFLGFRGFGFAWVLHFAMMAWMAASVDAAQPALGGSWFRVRDWELPSYRRLGVWWFMRLLRRIGWERIMRVARPFDGTRESLTNLDRATRMSEFGHNILAVIGTVLAATAAGMRAFDAAAWLFGLTVALHAYPILLQRAVRSRVQRVRRT